MATMLYREALNQAMREEMERNEEIFLLGEEVAQYDGAYKVSQGLLAKFGPKRVIDTPISELGFVGLGVGAAMAGTRPIVEVMTFNFALLALDAIVNTAAKVRAMTAGQLTCPVVIRGPGGAGGALGAQHSQALEAHYVHVPGLTVVAPSTPADAKGLLKAALRAPDPVVFIEAEQLYSTRGEVPEGEHVEEIGRAAVRREGRDLTLISWSRQARLLQDDLDRICDETGSDIEFIDLRTLRPLDEATLLASVRRTNRAVIVEEGWPFGGVGAEIVDRLQRGAFDYLDAPVERVTGLDVPMPYSPPLEKLVLPSFERVCEAIRRVRA